MTFTDEKPKFKLVGYDDWSRALYKSEKTGYVYVEVDGSLYTHDRGRRTVQSDVPPVSD